MKGRARRRRSQAETESGKARPAARARKARRPGRRDFDPDYSYVKKDLRRIALLAGFFLVILVILALILN